MTRSSCNRFPSHRVCCLLLALAAISSYPRSQALSVDEENEIFTVREDSLIVKEVKKSPDFVESEIANTVTSSTVPNKKDLEETIRDSVKTEIELEQNISGFLDVLKDIPEADVRQKLTEEILAVEKTQKSLKDMKEVEGARNLDELVQTNVETVRRHEQLNDEMPTTSLKNKERNSTVNADVVNRELETRTNLREARNLIAEFNDKSNSLEDIENILDSMENETNENSIHKVIESIIEPDKHKENLDNLLTEGHSNNNTSSLESDDTRMLHPIPIHKWIATTSRSATDDESAKIVTTLQQEEYDSQKPLDEETTTLKDSEDENLSISLEETFSATEPPILLDEISLDELVTPSPEIDEFDPLDTTVAPIVTSWHSVIKKQGVFLSEDMEIDENTRASDTLNSNDPTTTIIPVTEPPKLENSGEVIDIPVGEDNEETHFTQTSSENPREVELIDEDFEETALSTTELVGAITEGITLKGSRSVSGMVDDVSATLLESFLPQNAERTVHDNLADERSAGIGKALPTRSVNEAGIERSTLLIVVCSSITLLFVVGSLTIFLISFQRQHGTLDIELQEQRCGKDNLDEEDADNTSLKLLEIELPRASALETADETDECL